ncbi:MAG: (d)CMP kinase [Clostridia bacterium]
MIVAIDGPAGSGKGTVTKIIAEKMNLQYIDTGAMYRCVALKMLEEKVSLEEKEKIKQILDNIEIDLKGTAVFLNGKEVTKEIRNVEVSNFSSPVSTISFVREKMVELQRTLANGKNIIMEGRDIGTVVFPNADVKIYLDATSEERAKRRVEQNEKNGLESNYNQILKDIIERDNRDMNREISPLRKADDAILVDTTSLSIDKVVEKISDIIYNQI